jgi:septum formation protein
VHTGIALVTANTRQVAAETTTVHVSPLTEAQIAAYIATGEPMGKAGAYAIQGRAARFIPRIEGCYFNVVGLPLARLTTTLLEALR